MSVSQRPWARIVAMLIASYVTLIGMWCRLDPETILVRAAGAALLAAFVTRLAIDWVPAFRNLG